MAVLVYCVEMAVIYIVKKSFQEFLPYPLKIPVMFRVFNAL